MVSPFPEKEKLMEMVNDIGSHSGYGVVIIPKCTNMDELRPRLLHISHSNNVQVSDVRLVNSPFWTTHIYKCDSVKLLVCISFHLLLP